MQFPHRRTQTVGHPVHDLGAVGVADGQDHAAVTVVRRGVVREQLYRRPTGEARGLGLDVAQLPARVEQIAQFLEFGPGEYRIGNPRLQIGTGAAQQGASARDTHRTLGDGMRGDLGPPLQEPPDVAGDRKPIRLVPHRERNTVGVADRVRVDPQQRVLPVGESELDL
ncbi:hypothetical protein B7C42_06053 [Nocardia cerradoensis]|uniref:Uncharacterized protein n=1 Tax=Nocardia cerradoensis TaxID=85688 RepID=A0A231GYV6_9NOCA|nr:hypothetical protein B7C42_08151 [Nocardia cerradoensis]OXR41711.1 hypothetical protein B7C42_06053 [Nocardia cerradoensis]